LAEKWAHGPHSLFGMLSRGFPNMFIMPGPFQQAVVTVNYTQLAVLGGEFVGRAIGLLATEGVDVFDVSAEAEQEWVKGIVDAYIDGSRTMAACTPSRINNEGHPEDRSPLVGAYRGGLGDWFGYRERLERWLEDGHFDGLELEVRSTAT
jgi:hypothetical protein